MKRIIWISIFLIISGCAVKPSFDLRNKDQIASGITVKYDQFRKETWYKAPPIKAGNIYNYKTWFLRGLKKDDGTSFTQVYVRIHYTAENWKFFEDAASNGEVLPTTKISRNVDSCSGSMGCSYTEDLAINISLEKLETLLNENGVLVIGIRDRYGENWIVDMTSEYISAFKSKFTHPE